MSRTGKQQTNLHSQFQETGNTVNYVGIAPSAASEQKVDGLFSYFFSQTLHYQRIAIELIS